MRSARVTILLVVVAIAAAATAVWLFPRALPIVALKQSLTRELALTRADSFFRAHSLAPTGARTAVRFQGSDSLRTFVELAGGGPDSLNALIRGDDISPFAWSVRAFVPSNPREARVTFAPDGRIIGFDRRLAEADRRPTISADSGQRLAEHALDTWIDDRVDRWRLVTSSYETIKNSGRIDRTYTFERVDRRIAGAPLRAEVKIAGDTPSRIRRFVEIPETFRRRYAEMRSANDLLALVAGVGILGIVIVGIVALSRFARARRVRWREPVMVGAVVGGLALAAGINEMPGSWYWYDTAMSPATFQAGQIFVALFAGISTAVLLVFTLAAAEAATRGAFPRHLDWWKLWRFRGTKEVAYQVGGGYAAAAMGFAYVTIFYLATRTLFGWWVPSELLDDPNQIASPMPWVSAIAASLNAGVWEEALFRALPLSLLSLWIGERPGRRWWMAAGVVVSAIVFGFAHASYESWPPYSRGVELFLEACAWAVLFINFGILVTVVAHFVYDLVLFGIFAGSGSSIEYRVTAAIILLGLLAPALAVAWGWVRQRGFTSAPEEARFAAWTQVAAEEPARPVAARQAGVFTQRARRLALAAAILGVIIALARPPQPTLGPPFTADRERVLATADSVLIGRGVNPEGWKRLTMIGRDSLSEWPRYLRQYKLVSEAQRFASDYAPPTWWTVRYVHTTGTTAQRTEEWRVRVSPDGRPLDTRHVIPDSARGRAADSAVIRRIALASLARNGIDTTKLRESELKETARPARRDVTLTYTDTTVKLPGGAAARAWVDVGGDEPLGVRRGVELPEEFLRADRARQITRMMIVGVAFLAILTLVVTGAIVVKRRRPALLNDGTLDRKHTFLAIGALALLAILSGLNGLPSLLSLYDTSEPWNRFLGGTALRFAMVIAFAMVPAGLWLALNAMRRRVGIPMLAGQPSRSASRDMLIAGLGLGGFNYAMTQMDDVVRRAGMPRAPTTALDQALPALAGIPDIPGGALMVVALTGIPILVVAGLTQRWNLRVLMAATILALTGVAVAAVSQTTDFDPPMVGVVIASTAVMWVAVAAWGTRSAWSWIVAVLAYFGLAGLRNAVYGFVWQERVAGALGLLVVSGLIALIARETTKPRRGSNPLTQS
jgi:membrane protease YdiL (CAAX protease family)